MDPFVKAWMFENWISDLNDDSELAKQIALLIGSFIDPERAKKMLGIGANVHVSSDQEFEDSMKIVKSGFGKMQEEKKRKRKRFKVKE